MKLELEGRRETFFVLFGVPFLTVLMVLGLQWLSSKSPVIEISPKIEVTIPKDSIHQHNEIAMPIPNFVVQKIETEKASPVTVENKIQQAPVEILLPIGRPIDVKIVNLEKMDTVPNPDRAPASAPEKKTEDQYGEKLPEPKGIKK